MTEWKKVNYLRQGQSFNYDFILDLPKPLADWDVFDYWEGERVRSMREHLRPDDVLFDVGAESGWLSVVYAKLCKVFLIEPTKEFWPNIRQIWERNIQGKPAGFFSGLTASFSDDISYNFSMWPVESTGELLDKNKYQYLHSHESDILTMCIDDIVIQSGVTPTALTIDVEGAEFDVLLGASNTLLGGRLKVWVSIHPDLMEKYGRDKAELIWLMKGLGYEGTHLATDHEEHWLFI